MNNFKKYSDVFTSNFQITEEQLTELSYQSIESWDSVGHMGLISSLEDTFDIMLDTDDIVDLSTFEKGIEILKKYDIVF